MRQRLTTFAGQMLVVSCLLIYSTSSYLVGAQEPEVPCVAALGDLPSAALGTFPERKAKFQKILIKCPTLPEAHYNFAVLLLENSEAVEAISHFEEAVKLRGDIDYRLGLGSAQIAKGDYAAAQAVYQEVLAQDPRSLRGLLGMATVLEKTEKVTEALDYLNRAYGVEPDNVFVNYNLGVLYDRLGQNDASIVSFERALKSSPRHFPAQFFLGLALQKAGRADEGLAALKKAAELPDASIDGLRAYAFALEEKELFDDAEVVLRRGLSSNVGNPQLLEQLAVVLLRKSQEGNARGVIEQLLERKPGDARVLTLYGWALLRLGELGAAESKLKEAVAKDPANAFGFYALSELYRQSGQLEAAKSNLETAYTLDPKLKKEPEKWWMFW